jgi:hypothetical protein
MDQHDDNLKQFKTMVLVPMQLLEKVQENQQKILIALSEMPNATPTPPGMIANKYIPESTAKEMLGKGTTWFWQMRKSGNLDFKKVGSKIFYSIESIEKLVEGSTE